MKTKLLLLKYVSLLTIYLFSMDSNAGSYYISGEITDITSGPRALLIKMDNTLPDNCVGSPYNWMWIKADDKVMVATALTMFITGNRMATVYTDGIGNSGFCEVNQYDPY